MPVIFVSDENLKKLTSEEYETISEKKEDVVLNDPTKIIPKSVFNQKLDELKMEKEKATKLQEQLNATGEMVTDKKLKEELAIKEAEYKNQMKQLEKQYQDDLARKNKEELIKDHLIQEKCAYPKLLLQQINLDEAIEKDGKILNMDSIILPLKDSYKNLFEKQVSGTPPVKGANPSTGIKEPVDRAKLIEQYNEAEKSGDYQTMVRTDRAIKALSNQQ